MINITSLGQLAEFADAIYKLGEVPKNLIIKLELNQDEFFNINKEIKFKVGSFVSPNEIITHIKDGISCSYRGIKFELIIKQ